MSGGGCRVREYYFWARKSWADFQWHHGVNQRWINLEISIQRMTKHERLVTGKCQFISIWAVLRSQDALSVWTRAWGLGTPESLMVMALSQVCCWGTHPDTHQTWNPRGTASCYVMTPLLLNPYFLQTTHPNKSADILIHVFSCVFTYSGELSEKWRPERRQGTTGKRVHVILFSRKNKIRIQSTS